MIFTLLGTAQIQNQNLLYNRLEANTHENKTPPLQCYVCNSAYDPRCADPFDPYTIGIINCSDRSTPEHVRDYLHLDRIVKPVVCRKMVQKGKLVKTILTFYFTFRMIFTNRRFAVLAANTQSIKSIVPNHGAYPPRKRGEQGINEHDKTSEIFFKILFQINMSNLKYVRNQNISKE